MNTFTHDHSHADREDPGVILGKPGPAELTQHEEKIPRSLAAVYVEFRPAAAVCIILDKDGDLNEGLNFAIEI